MRGVGVRSSRLDKASKVIYLVYFLLVDNTLANNILVDNTLEKNRLVEAAGSPAPFRSKKWHSVKTLKFTPYSVLIPQM